MPKVAIDDLEVDTKTLARWNKIQAQFDKMQEELEKYVDARDERFSKFREKRSVRRD